MPHGSPTWQGVILLCAFLFLLWEGWRGWRAGFVRSGLNLAAIVTSALVLYFGSQVASAPFGGMGTTTGFITGVVVGGGLAFVVFAIIWLLGALLFKRTEHQGSGFIRFFWGLGGAAFGLLLGLFLLWGGISIIRSMGALAESRITSSHAPSGIERVDTPGQPTPSATPNRSQKLAANLVTLKESLELGPTGNFVKSVDLMPPDFYELILEAGQVINDQDAMLRLIQYPGVQKAMQNPRIVELVNDPAVINAAETKNFMGLINNKTIIAIAQDPSVIKDFEQVDWRAALKFALETDPSSPAPSPRSSP